MKKWIGVALFLIDISVPFVLAAQTPSPTPETKNMPTFEQNLPKDLKPPADAVEALILREYGAVFVARGNVTPPKTIVFRDGAEVADFQKSVDSMTENIEGVPMKLQAPAMRALVDSIREAKDQGLTISPRDVDAAARSYFEAVGLWASRVEPALDHWTTRGRMTSEDAARIRSLTPYGQVSEVLSLERRGMYFAKDLQKSIIYSVAPPGTSQHLSMLAFDVTEHENARVRSVLNKHGWFQTVVSDLPHFTYLGVSEAHLPQLGLKKKLKGGRVFWVPDL
jgi:hypothetical protein